MTRLPIDWVDVVTVITAIPDIFFAELLNVFPRLATECPEDYKSLPFNRNVGSVFPNNEIATVSVSSIRQKFVLQLFPGPPLRWFSIVAKRGAF